MNTLTIDGLTFEINEPVVLDATEVRTGNDIRIVVSKHLVTYARSEDMSVYWDEDENLFKIYTGKEGLELYVSKEVAEEVAKFLEIPRWAYDLYNNVVTLKDGEWIYTEI
ncbi:hypothetical protein [Shewanella xiamenensis]|uniref:hypothetical protein n=1 Tax=Shewanella xiamenensis TaxID=332186 RepID=UPI0024A7A161|nr:hypothetical protein [Shewanella xiamenensis]MDI5854078.1 hypothetical protein [Shewanella xiamenensis]MDI5858063.1 hypothetical protein [Shewanella xiamenensis]MDI5866101.1 hypothetical protein [Shewanella xiamenensis]MDI5869970.1 hypothetical protein [Shewanella xiamenensis]